MLNRMSFCKRLVACGLCGAALASAQGATTFSQLLVEIAQATPGATIYVENDMEATSALPVSTAITLTSPAGQTNVITRAANYGGVFINFSDAASELTLANVTVDWNKAAGSVPHFAMLSAGSLTLDAGAEVRNCDIGGNTGGIYLTGTARLVMNDGAVIRGFEGSGWAHGVQIGNNGGSPVFEMNGGLITECADHNSSATSSLGGYGGVVYVYGGDYTNEACGRFILHGGTITGNTSDRCTAGVVSWGGRWYLSGTACVTNNVGGIANDAWIERGYLFFDGDYWGRMTMRGLYEGMPDSSDGGQWAAYVGRPDGQSLKGPIAGAGNVSSQRNPNRIINGTTTGTQFNFGDRKASVGPGRYDEVSLHAALPHANQGDVVQIVADMVMDNYSITGSNYNGLTNVTLVGRPGSPVRVTRSAPSLRMLTVSHATVRLENLVFDGEGKFSPSETLLSIGAEGDVTLGAGAVLCNAVTGQQRPAVNLVAEAAHLTMLDGSAIHSCATTNEGSYATAIRVGEGNGRVYTNAPLFEMKGGVISNCVSAATGPATGGWGGAVYVQNATFAMSGGMITNNSALFGGSAGVMTWESAKIVFSGSACIAGNPGVKPDVFRNGGATLYMEGDFRGWVGVSSDSQAYDTQLPVICREGSTGAWSFFSAGTDPIGLYRGYNWSKKDFGGNDIAYWGNPVGWIDDAGFPSWERVNMPNYLPTAYDLDDADVRAGFPHTFKGTALDLDGTVALTFADAEAMKSRVPLVLYTAAGDGVFTGTWSFTVPEATGGAWKVRKVTNGSGVAAYVLDWAKSGMALVIR